MSKTIELSESQIWVVAKALLVLTSDEQSTKLWIEFPQLDFNKLSEDVNDILSKLGDESEDFQEVAQ